MVALGMIDVEALIRLQEASYARADGGLLSSWPREAAMDRDELGSFLLARRYCVLATTTPRGRALARPVAFTVTGSAFWFATVRGSRLRSLEHTPWGSIVVADGDVEDHRAVAADGPATIVDAPGDGLLSVWEARHGSRPEWAAAFFEIRPARLFSYSRAAQR